MDRKHKEKPYRSMPKRPWFQWRAPLDCKKMEGEMYIITEYQRAWIGIKDALENPNLKSHISKGVIQRCMQV